LYTDPDAQIGWDSHRKCFFFGHHFYEISVSVEGHDLPLTIRLDPGNASDFTASLHSLDRLRKDLAALPELATFIADAGHDADAIYRYRLDAEVTPVIPLAKAAPGRHPVRDDVTLSPRGVPTCKALRFRESSLTALIHQAEATPSAPLP
jgi:hypothetical protein